MQYSYSASALAALVGMLAIVNPVVQAAPAPLISVGVAVGGHVSGSAGTPTAIIGNPLSILPSVTAVVNPALASASSELRGAIGVVEKDLALILARPTITGVVAPISAIRKDLSSILAHPTPTAFGVAVSTIEKSLSSILAISKPTGVAGSLSSIEKGLSSLIAKATIYTVALPSITAPSVTLPLASIESDISSIVAKPTLTGIASEIASIEKAISSILARPTASGVANAVAAIEKDLSSLFSKAAATGVATPSVGSVVGTKTTLSLSTPLESGVVGVGEDGHLITVL